MFLDTTGTRCSKRTNASAVPTGRRDVVNDWAACSAITTALRHRSSSARAGRNGWSGGELLLGLVYRRARASLAGLREFENTSRIRAFGFVRVFGHDGHGLRCPHLVIGDGHLGIWAAMRNVFPEAEEQRCWNHRILNVLDRIPERWNRIKPSR